MKGDHDLTHKVFYDKSNYSLIHAFQNKEPSDTGLQAMLLHWRSATRLNPTVGQCCVPLCLPLRARYIQHG